MLTNRTYDKVVEARQTPEMVGSSTGFYSLRVRGPRRMSSYKEKINASAIFWGIFKGGV